MASPRSKEGIEARALVRDFPKVRALDHLDVSIPPGELYGLVGPNGSGKTTLIRILMGLDRATEGSALVLGEAPGSFPHVMGYMPQDEALYPDLSVADNLRFFAGLYGVSSSANMRSTLELVRLWDERRRLVSELSGGMRRRVSLAVALVHAPTILLLDEPTVGVDPLMRNEFWDSFRERARAGATILITTHHMEEALRCDRLGLLWRGSIFREGTPKEILEEANTASLDEAFAFLIKRQEAHA